MSHGRYAYVTLLTNTPYLPGVLVLHRTLQTVQSRHPLVVMVTPSLPADARDILRGSGIRMREINSLEPQGSHVYVEHDMRFADTWTKLRAFEVMEYDRIVLLDCDMIVKKNMDDLFEIDLAPDHIAAAHVCACNPRRLKHYPADWIPENCAHKAVASPTSPPPIATESTPRPYGQLNSGTVVLNPSKELADAVINFLHTHDKIAEFSFPDQDLLTAFFKGKWKPLPWYYNALRTLRNVHPQLWSDDIVRCVHYILADKPWQSRVTAKGTQFETVNEWWWQVFDDVIKEMELKNVEGSKLVLSHVNYL